LTSTQVTAGDQVFHRLVRNAEPVDSPVNHSPVSSHRSAKSALPSPLKSATWNWLDLLQELWRGCQELSAHDLGGASSWKLLVVDV
jgi:hypothetical protein